MTKRFVPIEGNERFPITDETAWYYDTERQVYDRAYVAVECYRDRNPNDYVRHDKLYLLFTDQAEYYAVCADCYFAYRHMQWSGHTRAPGWETRSYRYLDEHKEKKGWCEFCDPVFGNGGWYKPQRE